MLKGLSPCPCQPSEHPLSRPLATRMGLFKAPARPAASSHRAGPCCGTFRTCVQLSQRQSAEGMQMARLVGYRAEGPRAQPQTCVFLAPKPNLASAMGSMTNPLLPAGDKHRNSWAIFSPEPCPECRAWTSTSPWHSGGFTNRKARKPQTEPSKNPFSKIISEQS